MIREIELWANADAVPPLQVEPERLHELIALKPCAPDDRVRLQLRSRRERDAGGGDRRDVRVGHHLDSALFERLSHTPGGSA